MPERATRAPRSTGTESARDETSPEPSAGSGTARAVRMNRCVAAGYRPQPSTSRSALLRGGSDAAFRHFVSDLLTVAERMGAMRDHFARVAGVTGPQYTMLMAIAQLERAHPAASGVQLSAVADYLRVSRAFVTTEAGILVRRRLLVKRPNPRDGRSALLRLSASGERLLDRVMPEVRAVNDQFFRTLGGADFRAACRIVAALLAGSVQAFAHVGTRTDGRRLSRIS
jgi:DNA-binding MarR family transcriptional regulator